MTEATMLSEGDRDWLEKRFTTGSGEVRDLTREFNLHKLDDQILSNAIKTNQQALQTHLDAHNESKTRRLQWSIARYTALTLLAITLLGILLTGILNHIELRSQRQEKAAGQKP